MAKKAKAKATKKRPVVIHTWTVTKPTDPAETVTAHDLSTYDGTLTFSTSDGDEYTIVRSFSHDAWKDVALVESQPVPAAHDMP
jgi:hypothetical protein